MKKYRRKCENIMKAKYKNLAHPDKRFALRQQLKNPNTPHNGEDMLRLPKRLIIHPVNNQALFNNNSVTFKFNNLAFADLVSLAQFHVAVNFDAAFRDHGFCSTSAIAQPRDFQ